MPAHWPVSGDTPGFFDRLVAHVQHIHNHTRDEYGALFHALGVPLDPLADVHARKAELRSRPSTLIHCDVHRKNCIVNDQRLWYLDWELALIGDPVYDLAVHLHKMTYSAEEESTLVRAVVAGCKPVLIDGWEEDLVVYRTFERLKSVLVDTVRYSQQIRDPFTPAALRDALIDKWRGKLLSAQPFWENRVPDESEAEALLARGRAGGGA